jgi:hypothetical protein
MTTLLASVGPPTAVSAWAWDYNKLAKLNPERQGFLAGEIAGVPVALTGTLTDAEQQELNKFEARWIGLKRKHLEDMAKDAVKCDSHLGVVLIASGADPAKAGPIVHAALQNLCSTIVVDRDLARGIGQELDRLLATSARPGPRGPLTGSRAARIR